MKRITMKAFLSLALLSSALCFRASAQYSIGWSKVSGGGGTSTGGEYSVSGTIGQHDAGGSMTNGNFSLTGGFWSLITAVQPTNAPFIFIVISGNNVILSWPNGVTAFALVHNNDPSNTNGWSQVLPLPTTVNGFNYVTNAVTPGNNFYRLRAP